MSTILDELIVKLQPNGIYKIDACFNKDKAKVDLGHITSTSRDTHVLADAIANPYDPNINGITFSTYYDFNGLLGDSDSLEIILKHAMPGGGVNYIMNKIAINDTRYPPPYSAGRLAMFSNLRNKRFSLLKDLFDEQDFQDFLSSGVPVIFSKYLPTAINYPFARGVFDINSLIITRNDLGYFDIQIELNHTSDGITGYSVSDPNSRIEYDTVRRVENIAMKALVLRVSPDAVNPPAKGTVSLLVFDAKNIDLASFGGAGLSVLITDKSDGSFWATADYKKASIAVH